MFHKILVFVLLLGAGFGAIVYTGSVKRFTGEISFAESWFGPGGTYLLYKLIGLILLAASILYITGTYEKIIPGFLLNGGKIPVN